MLDIHAILDLEKQAQETTFPPASKTFHVFKINLRNLIQYHCGHYVSSTLEYDDNNQVFYVKVRAPAYPLIPFTHARLDDNFACELSKYFYINPMHPLEPQLDAINDLYKQLDQRVAQLRTLLTDAIADEPPTKGNHGDS